MKVCNEPEAILQEYGNMVYRLAMVRTGNPADAEDVFQEVFLRLVQRKQDFSSEEHQKAWLIRVTINRSNSLWKSAWKQKTVPLEDNIAVQEWEEENEVYEKVMRLPPKYRMVIHLFYYEDMPLEKISEVLQIRYDATAQRLSRARKLLKKQWKEGDEIYGKFPEEIPEELG